MTGDGLDHPLRYELVNELHARPSPRLTAPLTVVFMAFKELRNAASRDRSADITHLATLAHRHGAPAPQPGAQHYAAQLGRYELAWESHTEFVTYAAFLPGLAPRPFDARVAEIFPAEWQQDAPGARLAALIVHVEHVPEDPAEIDTKLEAWFARDGLAAAQVMDGLAVVASDFRIDANGFMRFAIFVQPGSGAGRTGRVIQRLIDLEIYRSMSMLGLGRGRALSALLNRLDPRISTLMGGLAGETADPEAVLHDLLGVSAELEVAATDSSFRFGATRAYAAIVAERLASLRESRFFSRQTLSEFMDRRFAPAMRTVASTEARLNTMLDRTERASELLRTRVDVERSGASRDLLARMDRRADLQLRLQNTVEGLSVVAISYYAVGLLSYFLTPLAHRIAVDKAVLTAGLVPVVVLAVWYAMRRIRRSLHDGAPE
ncbi:DUF3422 family protein [Paracoccus suum]|uniref:DUF3422 family protein n=1 Tax=Paracoccus suum TaxID=2259340 RepID=A0A344PLZ0_9RHOB|nr:DUF3422 domain-containing protein [Paracoccus suum]AXC50395.1 DUF3422 family protein [Paracoccus suum]